MLEQHLPREVVSEIFVLCLPDHDRDRIWPFEAPALLCAVSSAWRQIAMDESRLWDTLVLPDVNYQPAKLGAKDIGSDTFLQSCGRRWFSRPGPGHLLTLVMDPLEKSTWSEEIAVRRKNLVISVQELIDHVGPHRFRKLELGLWGIVSRLDSCFPFEPPGDKYRELTTLTLNTHQPIFSVLDSHPNPDDWTETHIAFSIAPKLRHFTLRFPGNTPLTLERLISPWSQQLTSLEIDGNSENQTGHIDVEDWVTAFKLCPNLTDAKLTSPPLIPPTRERTLSHPVRSLTVYLDGYVSWRNQDGDRWGSLRGPVQFTGLRHLHLQFTMFFGKTSDNLFHALLGLSDTLETLKLSTRPGPNFVPPDIEDFVRDLAENPHALPHLTRVTFPYVFAGIAEGVARLMRATVSDGTKPPLFVTVQTMGVPEGPDPLAGVDFGPGSMNRFILEKM